MCTLFLLAYEFDCLFALDLDNPEDFPSTKNSISRIANNGFTHIARRLNIKENKPLNGFTITGEKSGFSGRVLNLLIM